MTTWATAPAYPPGYSPGRLDGTRYDRSPELTPAERQALAVLLATHGWGGRTIEMIVARLVDAERLVRPLRDAVAATEGNPYWKERALVALLRACAREERAFWTWDRATWARHLTPEAARHLTANRPNEAGATRHFMIAATYLLGCLPDPSCLPMVQWEGVAQKVFGRAALDAQVQRVKGIVLGWGYSFGTGRGLRGITTEALLRCHRPELEAITGPLLEGWRREVGIPARRRATIFTLARALAHLGIFAQPLPALEPRPEWHRVARAADIAPAWVAQVERWERTSTLAPHTRATTRHWLLKVGRWLRQQHPAVLDAADWTRDLAADAVAMVNGMRVGDYAWNTATIGRGAGQPLAPATKYAALNALRQFFNDAQDWEWIPRRFEPSRSFPTPRAVRVLLGPRPRTIEDDVWAKLLWAGLNLTAGDVPRHGEAPRSVAARSAAVPQGGDTYYPLAMLQALTVVWLFSGLRSDEIVRLRVGCVHRQPPTGVGAVAPDDGQQAAVCLLDVPAHKTGAPFTKPVDPLVGRAVAAWEAVRPVQPLAPDRRTGEPAALLFSYRAQPLASNYLNTSLIPALCRKAGVPEADARGRITSHRAR